MLSFLKTQKNKMMKTTQESIQKKNFINGTLSPAEAQEVLEQLINKQIQMCKIKSLSQWIGNHNFDSSPIDQKISELDNQKNELRDIVTIASEKGFSIDLGVNLELRLSK
jgi:hypothetical protein